VADDVADVSSLVKALADEDAVVRTRAAKDLGRLGPEAVGAVDALARALRDVDPMVRSMAASALGKIGAGARSGALALVLALGDPVFPVRFWAAEALGRIGADVPGALEGLEELARDENPAVRAAARKAVASLRRGSEGAGPAGRGPR
jgi:HEAT repeat protein